MYGSQLAIDFLQEFGDIDKYVCSNIHQSLSGSQLQLIVLQNILCEPWIDEGYDAV